MCVKKTKKMKSTAKLWHEGSIVGSMEGHEHGTEVCCLNTGEIITGSNKHIHYWANDCKKIKTINNAHEHVIRKIKKHPLGFVTCANDG